MATHLGEHDRDSESFPVFTSMASAIDGPVTVYAVPMRPTGRVARTAAR